MSCVGSAGWWRLIGLFVGVIGWGGSILVAQEGGGETPSLANRPAATRYFDDSGAAAALTPPSVTVDALLRRLERTEAQLAQLQASQTAYEQDSRMLASFDQPGYQVRDPSITTVDQQTYQPSREKKEAKKWYDRLSIRGYAQFRINEVLDEEGAPAQYVGDRSVGANQNFLIRRARVIISGDVSDHMYVYLQPDFASSVSGSAVDVNQFCQIRDWYGDLYLDTEKINRIRIGQSKVPYGWENMQSSSNRIPLDRDDALNSAVRNERDLGIFYYWTPEYAQDLFKFVLDEGLKGSGNYGVFGVGVYNGQGGSFNEQNENLHVVTRLTLPRQLASGQVFEIGVQAYSGQYAVLSSVIDPPGAAAPDRPLGTLERGTREILDERIAMSFMWYPQPLGFQAEWNVGRGPGLNDAQTEVVDRPLTGGYAMLHYRWETPCWGTLFPFIRYQYYKGGYKAERNAPFSEIEELETGVEWQLNPQMEFTIQHTHTDRTNTVAMPAPELSYQQFRGDLLRMQFQINY
ncbi:MAG: porin [Pirellulaceae bacterium]|nr:porin [Pirellulaceae bacterium]